MTPIVILAVALVGGLGVGWWLREREGTAREVARPADINVLTAVGAPVGQPAIVHFSAEWCAPCKAVSKIVASVADDVEALSDIEVNIDEFGSLAKTLGVLTLPTTFVIDPAGVTRYRFAGVPTRSELENALAHSGA